MKIAVHDADKTDFPNLALMKLASFHRGRGDSVEWFSASKKYDRVYSSKVFTWTEEDPSLPKGTIKGGTGYDITACLPAEVEQCCPDYSLYGLDFSLGFLTRGCPNRCPWCFVPKKEGAIQGNAFLKDFVRHSNVVLMDNNVLAHPHGIAQIEEAVRLGIRIDFNQGLDARLIDDSMAKLLARVKWLRPLRMACDQIGQMKHIERATRLLRWHNCTPRNYFVYVLIGGPASGTVEEAMVDALERLQFLKGMALDPFAQPYRDAEGTAPPKVFKELARWVDRKHIFKSCTWNEYIGQKKAQGSLLEAI